MDFIKELGGSTRYNFHSHTEFCDGRAQMEAFAREAVKQGFTHYGFSPHSPIPIESPCNMAKHNVPLYLAEVERIRRDYGDKCRFYAAMEIDYLDDSWGPAITYFRELPLDYRIGSVHFIPSQDGEFVDIDGHFEGFARKMHRYFHDDIRYVVETFYSQSRKMVLAGGFDILGHLDKIGHNASLYKPGIEEEDWYRSLVNDLIDLAIEKGLTIEINTKAYATTAPAGAPGHPAGNPDGQGRLFPSKRYLSKLVGSGVTLLINSDAHVPVLIDASRSEVARMLSALPHRIHSNRD